MKHETRKLLKELYEIDPSFREKEDELVKIIEKLLASRPDATMDASFRKKLKEKLLRRFREEKAPLLSRLFSRPRVALAFGFGSIAAVIAVVFGFAIFTRLIVPGSGDRKQVASAEAEKQGDIVRDDAPGEAPGLERAIPPSTNQETRRADNSADAVIAKAPDKVKAEEKRYKAPFELGDADGLTDGATAGGEQYMPVAPADNSGFIAKTKSGSHAAQSLREIDYNTEEYAYVKEKGFVKAIDEPLSTFSIDVDTASYANVRRFIRDGALPPRDAVRIEELINYFRYDYPSPQGKEPFTVTTEAAPCPWEPSHSLVLIGIQGKKIETAALPASNIVFLIDVSGSMESADKLGLIKRAFGLLVNELRPIDRVAIVVYAGAAGLVLPPTPGNNKPVILGAIDRLTAGGSTAGGEGLALAYATAQQHYNPQGNNRVVLATDGDFNVGPSSDGELVRIIEEKRKAGIFLTVLGFGTGNYKDSKMEQLADKGNGNYAYIDTLDEARKVLVSEMGGTLLAIAKDVKVQVEWNPARVESYRLIGYANRLLANEDFADDTKDAGELGAGHTVTVLYETIPAAVIGPKADAGAATANDKKSETTLTTGSSVAERELKYQRTSIREDAYRSDEVMTLRLRYKQPDSDTSGLIEMPVTAAAASSGAASENLRFAASVAEWGLILSGSEYMGNASIARVIERAREARGRDAEGYRSEFIKLAEESGKLLQ